MNEHRPRDRTATSPLRQALRITLSAIAVIILIGWVLPAVTGTSWPSIATSLSRISMPYLIALFVLELCVILTYAVAVQVVVPGLRYWHGLLTHTTSTAISNSVPFGSALSLGALYAMLRSYGFSRSTIALAVALTSLADTVVKLALPVVGLAALALAGQAVPRGVAWAALSAAVLGALVLGTVIAVACSARALSALTTSLQDTVHRVFALMGRSSTPDLVTPALSLRQRATTIMRRGWHRLILPATGVRVIQFIMFVVCLRAVGEDIGLAAAFATFALGRLLAMVPLTPSGIGITETGTAAALVTLGADPTAAVSAVLLLTLATTVLQVPIGAVTGGIWWVRRHHIHPYGDDISTPGASS
ncbi:lysylphosphatidylglycerol synthase transmembrane domain-containing protein [Devriesea agamarum]|uniref:lysylphosphatidylglycerol synthase transmembrane domain-containing protein n=1 Tax=Devriesea agamarum TaxID=472569 RepID=UPI00071C39A5|nr:lysylphosphatidylglycerol synthase transmembrane domain-containing protein [Devriesea agamarum]